jgi:hypothetical protein
MNKYACLFMDIAYAREYYHGYRWSKEELKRIWMEAKTKGVLSGDLNGDGDMDDKGELEIQSHNAVASLLGSPLTYIPGHHPPTTRILNRYAIGCFFNPRTQFRHFGVIIPDHRVIYDSMGSSVTIREGVLESIRLYEVVT